MSLTALLLVLFAALLHAGWNALVKAVDDRAGVLAAVSAAHALLGLGLIAISPAPAMASWPAIATSASLHYGYYVLLFRAYRHGDLSQVYPISRGMAPALVALSAAVLIGESLTPQGWLGLACVCGGVGLLALQRGAAQAPAQTVAFSICLGLLIAAYSVADGIGVRHSESVFGYMGWLFLLEFPVPLAIALRRHRSGLRFERRVLILGAAGGVAAVAAYGIVLYVKTIAPLGAVSAVRESSVVFAAGIGILLFKERPIGGRLLAAAVVATGVILLALA
ncbi:EamA family transporter [Rhodobacter sp. HX-7-19]|uniref:EamA family transporter n=1 Tax=Paragemmobacter kunshanensis TaxID=2583234 RepID=A0A6M1TXV9_9RHOB|nr:EamA family transporter [Rhodobacter kunshanensis]NGQ93030.1 EamA family transporter [Rhodobacter kunshanensis]